MRQCLVFLQVLLVPVCLLPRPSDGFSGLLQQRASFGTSTSPCNVRNRAFRTTSALNALPTGVNDVSYWATAQQSDFVNKIPKLSDENVKVLRDPQFWKSEASIDVVGWKQWMDSAIDMLKNYVAMAKTPPSSMEDLVSSFASSISSLMEQIRPEFPTEMLSTVSEIFAPVATNFASLPVVTQVAIVSIFSMVTLMGSVFIYFALLDDADNKASQKNGMDTSNDFRAGYEPYLRGEYDPNRARAYYSQYPLLVMRRSLQILRLSNKFIFNFLVDKYIFRDEELQRSKRAAECLELINRVGPTAIKVGQALSVRPDLIPTEYATALATLQDRVPPFSSAQAKRILQQELGEAAYEQLTNLDMEQGPVASASIGQVYRGMAKCSTDGTTKEVAVKIQRPNVLAEIALDLFIVREFAPFYQRITGSATDLQALANEWGRGFIGELNYEQEAFNTKKFNAEMQNRNIRAVTAPVVVDEFCTNRVLVTEWVQGTRLDQSTEGDIPRLCSVALDAYLVMLLETGTLHCDPHPGNLLRTKDGKLCILDFGMTLDTDPNLQYALLEFIAHLTSEDFGRVPDDLVKLGFLKAERMETVRASGVLEPLTYMLKQAGQGGGADKVRERIFAEFREKYPDMDDEELRVQMRSDMKQQMEEARSKASAASGITMEVEELQKRNRDAFTIPEWFLYTSRAFLTLEGISLQADENYSLIQSCFPYVAKRLLKDVSPRAQKALRDLIYGASDSIDVERLSDIAEGFSTYTTTTKIINQGVDQQSNSKSNKEEAVDGRDSSRNLADTEAAITLAKDSADILLASDGNLMQQLLVNEGALATSAQVKDALRDAIVDGPKRFRESLPLNLGSILPATPLEESLSPFLEKTEEEEKAQALASKLSTFLPTADIGAVATASEEQPSPIELASSISMENVDVDQVALVAKELRENLPQYAPLVGQLGGKFASTLLETASKNIESTLDDEKASDQLVRAAAKGLSSAARQGADVIKKQTAVAEE